MGLSNILSRLFLIANSAIFLEVVLPTAAASQDSVIPGVTEKTVKQAVALLDKALKCPVENIAEGTNTRHSEYSSIGNEFEMGIELHTLDKWLDKSIDVSKAEPWDSIGSITPTVFIFGASWSKLSFVQFGQDSVQIGCQNAEKCISHYEFVQPETLISPSGSEMYGNAGGDYANNKTTMESRQMLLDVKGLCADQVKNVVLAMRVLIQAAKTGVVRNTNSSPAYEFSPPPALTTLAIRQNPGKEQAPIGAIPLVSGPLYPTNCKQVAGYKSEWCKIKWAGVEGWVSKTYLVPFN